MKLSFSVALVALLVGAGHVQSHTGRKLALIVAIGDYPASSGYGMLHSANDVPLVRGSLLAQGFDSANILVVQDSAATREGILGGLDWLTTKAGPGDVVVFHYSGHGHRITDDNGDELDGYDEVLVPYGAPADLHAVAYHGERHIRDDELGARLAVLRHKVGAGGAVLVTIDACFSGSATRGQEERPVRGVMQPIEVTDTRHVGRTRGAGVDSGSGATEVPDLPGQAAPLVVISAARHDEPSREAMDDSGFGVGSLSLALSRVLPRADSSTSYRALFDRIGVAMASMDLGDQRPQIEGDVDTRVFSGQAIAQRAFVRVATVSDDSTAAMVGGTLLGLLPGTRIAFFASGTATPDNATPLATGIVRAAHGGTAVVTVARPRPERQAIERSWAFVTDYAYGDFRVGVRIDPRLPVAFRNALRDSLASVTVARLVLTNPALLIAPAQNGGTIQLVAAADNVPLTAAIDPASPGSVNRVREAVRSYARSRQLRRLELTDPRITVTMELIPTQRRMVAGVCEGDDTAAVVSKRTAGNEWELNPGDVYLLRLRNEGKDSAFVTVLSLTPDGAVQQLFPPPLDLGSDNLLAPGRSYLLRDSEDSVVCYYAEELLGQEVVKLFATHDHMDFAAVLTEHPEGTRSALNPLQRLIADAYSGTRSDAAIMARGTGSTYGITINVVKPQEQ
ncbi:MAG: caspase family protein [Gemmatimonadales bacterium]